VSSSSRLLSCTCWRRTAAVGCLLVWPSSCIQLLSFNSSNRLLTTLLVSHLWFKPRDQSYIRYSIGQSFKTRPGPAGLPGTRPTRAWDRSGLRQKPARELARGNPVDPGPDPPGQTRVRPGQFFLLFSLSLNDVVFCHLKCQNAKD
jgi:hypothetical protein